jgi:heptosyltransferase-1
MRRKGRIPLRDFPAQRVAIIKPSALGDIIHSLPVLSALRRRYPDAHFTWVVNNAYEPLLHGHPELNATLAFDRAAVRKGVFAALHGYISFMRLCRQQNFDLVVDLQGLLRSGLMTIASGATRRVGLSTAREGATLFYTDTVKVPDFDAIHAVDRYWLVAEAFGVGDGEKRFHVHVPDTERAWAAELLRGKPRPYLALSAGSRWETKRWLPGHFAELLRRMEAKTGGTVICVGSSDEASLAQAATRAQTMPVIDLVGRTSLPQLAALLAQADVMLANDTGPLHLAAALGRPVVAPYTCTKVRLNGPYGFEAGTVESKVHCQGSYIKKCASLVCMSELTPDRLWPALQGILETWHRRSA